MPVLPVEHSTSDTRQPRHPYPADDSTSSTADTSSHIRLRNDGTPFIPSSPSQPEDSLELQPQLPTPYHILLPYSPQTRPTPNTHLLTHRDTSTTPSQPLDPRQLDPRQVFFALPLSYYGVNSGPSSGTVVGIVLGSVFGYLILLYLINSLMNRKPGSTRYIEGDASEIVVTRRSEHDRSSGKQRRRRRRTTATEVRSRRTEMSASTASSVTPLPPPPAVRQPSPRRERTERIVVEERRVRREESRAPPPPVAMPMGPGPDIHETINININEERPERRVEGDDTVEVIEEGSEMSPPPSGGRRRRESARGAYRTVDPGAYGGGRW